MMINWIAIGLPAAAAVVGPGIPWWAYVLIGLPCVLVYICSLALRYRFAMSALAKARQVDVPAVVSAVASPSASRS